MDIIFTKCNAIGIAAFTHTCHVLFVIVIYFWKDSKTLHSFGDDVFVLECSLSSLWEYSILSDPICESPRWTHSLLGILCQILSDSPYVSYWPQPLDLKCLWGQGFAWHWWQGGTVSYSWGWRTCIVIGCTRVSFVQNTQLRHRALKFPTPAPERPTSTKDLMLPQISKIVRLAPPKNHSYKATSETRGGFEATSPLIRTLTPPEPTIRISFNPTTNSVTLGAKASTWIHRGKRHFSPFSPVILNLHGSSTIHSHTHLCFTKEVNKLAKFFQVNMPASFKSLYHEL